MIKKKGELYVVTYEGKVFGEYNTKSQANGAEKILAEKEQKGLIKDFLKDMKQADIGGRKILVPKTAKVFRKEKKEEETLIEGEEK